MALSDFAAKSLRELRLRAGMTQAELAKRSGVSAVVIGHIEQGEAKPRQLTWRRLLKALSAPSEGPDPSRAGNGQEPAPAAPGEILNREEFFRRLKPKLGRSLAVFFSEFLIATFLKNAEFFSRQWYYPGDFATAVELLGDLLRAQKRISEARRNAGDHNESAPLSARSIQKIGGKE